LSIFVCPPVFSNVDFSPEYPFFPTCAESKINIFLLIYQIRTTTGTKYYKCRGTAYNSESFEFSMFSICLLYVFVFFISSFFLVVVMVSFLSIDLLTLITSWYPLT
jgi:hypothetical protein